MSGDDINQVSYALGQLKASVDSLTASVQTSVEQQHSVNDKMERRLSKVESKQHWYAGAGTTLGSVVGIFVTYIWGRH